MNERLTISVIAALANGSLGLVVLFKDFPQRVNQYFAWFSFSVAAWALSNGLVDAYASTPWGIVWARMAFVSASFIPLTFALFANVFPSPRPDPWPASLKMCVFIGLVFVATSMTPFIARRTDAIGGTLHVSYGPLHIPFGLYFVSVLAYSLYLLNRKLYVLKGLEKLQVRYVFFGMSLPILGGTITNLLIPLMSRSSRFSPYGPLFSILLVATIAHTIIRHRLMNIRVVIGRSVAYLFALIALGGIFTLIIWSGPHVPISRPGAMPLWVELVLVLLIAALFQPVRRLTQAWIDRYFFRERYDYQRTVREISRTMAGILDLQPLLRYACDAISRTVKPEYVAVYAKKMPGATYDPLIVHTSIQSQATRLGEPVEASSSLLRFLVATKQQIVADELRRSESTHPAADSQPVIDEMHRVGAELVLPILEEGDLAGFFILGPKRSGDPYFAEDLDLLTTLTGQATIALKNARLYSQVVLVNEYVENILTTIDSAVVAVAADGTITLFNSAARRLTGLAAEDVKDAPVQTLPSSLATLIDGTLRDNDARTQVETAVQDPVGRVTPVICSTSPLRDRTGAMLGAVAVFSDLTGLKKLEAEKRQAERLASIGALASGIAHEIKNPLVAIKTFAELLPERFSDGDFRDEFAKVVITEIERIDDLVARLRGLATPAVRPLPPVDIREPLQETLALLRGQFEQSRVAIHVSYASDLPLIAADVSQLKQLLINLFLNAIEAMEFGGDLLVRVCTREQFGVHMLLVEITDTGCGIPEELLTKIFDPFVTTKSRGSGLGLSICRGITDAHHATIRAQNNRYGKGATISIEFPALDTRRRDRSNGTSSKVPNT